MKERKTIKRSDRCELVQLTISFNIKNHRERWLLDQADALPNFSGEMKRLFEESLRGPRMAHSEIRVQTYTPEAPEPAAVDFDPMEAFL